MHVLINAASARRGGIATYTQNLITHLLDRKIKVTIAALPDLDAGPPEALLKVNAADYSPFRRLIWEQSVWRLHVARIRPDVLFSSANFGLIRSPVPQVLLMREGGLFDRFYLSHVAPMQGLRALVARSLRRRLMLLSTSQADRVITPSHTMRDSLLRWKPALERSLSVNYYGARPDLFKSPAEPRPWRGDGTMRLIYVSVYYPHKSPAVVCEAVEELNDAGMPAHATITMTLPELDRMPGSARDRIFLRRALGLGQLTLGDHAYTDLPQLYASHDVFVFPSVSETFGHPMVEAMASGLPIVAADTAINREICGDGALYFRPFSARELAARLRQLDSDPHLRTRLTEIAKMRVLSSFSWEKHIDRLVETFEGAIDARRGKRLRG